MATSRYSGHWQAVDARGAQHGGEVSVEAATMATAMGYAVLRIENTKDVKRPLAELTITLAREGA